MTTRPTIDDLFDRPITYPDVEARERLSRLVGLNEHKARLAKILGLLINPAGLDSWARKYHPGAIGLLDAVLRRPPLVVLAGDVGSGKSELAETIGDDVAPAGARYHHSLADEPFHTRTGARRRDDSAVVRCLRSHFGGSSEAQGHQRYLTRSRHSLGG